MKEKRIAILSYHKFPGEPWPSSEFGTRKVTLVHGEEVDMELAERGACLSNGLWVREIRQRSSSGTQSSILCTDYRGDATRVAACLFARWCQENFFKYMREHYHLDRLIEYGCEPIPDSTPVVNPQWRALDAQVRHHNGKLTRELASFAAISLPEDPTPAQFASVSERCQSRAAYGRSIVSGPPTPTPSVQASTQEPIRETTPPAHARLTGGPAGGI